MKSVAIIPAGGAGKRMEGAVSKQYLPIAGIPILFHTLMRFQESPSIDEIFLILPADDVAVIRLRIAGEYRLSKVSRILAGGRERQDSVRNGLDAVSDEDDIVLIHDAVRPLISQEMIRLAVEGAAACGAVAVGVPATDTIKRVDRNNVVCETIDRSSLWLVQTPQAFQRLIIKRAYDNAYQDHFIGTDDACLVERMGIPVTMIPGGHENIKITQQGDLLIAEALLKQKGP